MGLVSYAQNFEDVILWRALEDATPGFYIDVGAQHPVVDSVSKAFYEHGWRGIHVEPTLEHANLLRADRPDETVVQAIVAERAGAVRFYEIPGTGLSTARQDIAEEHHSQRGFPVQSQVVTAVTLDDLLGLAPSDAIHWLKIDVEGFEREVLSGWRESARRPWVVVVEATYPSSTRETYEDWESLILSKGYSLVYRDGLNRYYLHESQSARAARFVFPPNVFDGFQLSGTATSMTAWLVNRHRETEEGLKTECDAAMHEYSARLQALQEKCRAAEAEQHARQSDVLEQALNHARLQHQSEVSRLESQLQDLRDALAKEREDAQFQQETLQGLASQALESRHAAGMEQLKQMVELERHYVEKIDSLREEWRKADAQQVAHADRALKEALAAQMERFAAEQERVSNELLLARNNLEEARRTELLTKAQALSAERENAQKLVAVHVAWREEQSDLMARHAQELAAMHESLKQANVEHATREESLQREVIAPIRQAADQWRMRAEAQSALIEGLREELTGIYASRGWKFIHFISRVFNVKCSSSILEALPRELEKLPGVNPVTENQNPPIVGGDCGFDHVNSAPAINEIHSKVDSMKIHHVNDLLSLHSEDLVEAAYQIFLGRRPDPQGRMDHINRLRSGIGRVALIAQIALSKEALAKAVSLPGLDKLIKDYRKERHWFWGRWYRQRALECTIHRLENKVDQLNAQIAMVRRGAGSVVNSQLNTDLPSGVTDSVAQTEGGVFTCAPSLQKSEVDLPVQVRRILRRMDSN